jgi:two-component system, NtrC family, response regulator AtoC
MARRTVKRPDRPLTSFHGIVTAAPQMVEFFRLLERVARTDSSVLIRGETGTGKELVARAVHRLSARAAAPFQALNCATLTPELLASELFGHVRGAFTGAIRDRRGLFARADGGSIFLDEIAEMPLDIQARLLRVLQDHTFVPLGGVEPVTVDVRVVSATHKALRDEVTKGRFREDLMYRIRVVSLHLPRLAERGGDVEVLAWHFIDEFNARGPRRIEEVEQAAMDAMLGYAWPGNIRELRNNIEHAFAVGEGPVLLLDELTLELRGLPPPGAGSGPEQPVPGASEAERIRSALERAHGRKGEAAKLLRMSRSTLWRKMRELRIE